MGRWGLGPLAVATLAGVWLWPGATGLIPASTWIQTEVDFIVWVQHVENNPEFGVISSVHSLGGNRFLSFFFFSCNLNAQVHINAPDSLE